MAFVAERIELFVDNETAKEDYTNETFDSMTVPVVNLMCDIFDMHIITSLTENTARGRRFFIGFNDDEPKLCIGWAVNNTYQNVYYLLMIGMFNGRMMNNQMDLSTSSSIRSEQFCSIIIEKIFSTTTYYYFIKYMKDADFIITSDGARSTSITQDFTPFWRFYILKIGTRKLLASANANGQVDTYDYNNDGRYTRIIYPGGSYLKACKNYIANTDFDYIAQRRIEHNIPISGLYIFSNSNISVNNIYNINGEYYFCLNVNGSDGSWLLKINYNP